MSVKKYINIDKDGYKVENQSPLSPAWMLSGKQNQGKVLTGGPDGFVIWAEGGSGGGTLDYEVLNNKPQINGLTLIGNITLNYLSYVEVSGNTLTFTHANGLSTTYTPSFPPQITEYLKSASVSQDNKTLTILDANGNNITFSPQTSEAIDQYIKSISVSNTDPNFISITYTNQASSATSFNVPKVLLQDINVNGNNLTITKYANNQASTVEYSPNIPQEYVKSASVNGNTLTLTKQNGTQVVFGISTEVINSTITSYLQNNFFTILKQHLGSGFVIDNDNKLISVSAVPQPPIPTFTGIFSYDSEKNKYRMYDPNTIFSPSDPIKYLLLDVNSSEPTGGFSYPETIQRQVFNEPIFINDPNNNFDGWNSRFSFLQGCIMFNQPLDLSKCPWTKIGDAFMRLCTAFNSSIVFPSTIQTIAPQFMEGCSVFNKSIQSIMTPNLQRIGHSFLSQCVNFSQDIDISNTNINTIEIDFFMYNCKAFASKQFYMTNKDVHIFKPYSYDDLLDVYKGCATDDPSSLIYQSGFHFSASNLTKQSFDDFHINSNGQTYYPLRNSSNSPYKKIVVNGVE